MLNINNDIFVFVADESVMKSGVRELVQKVKF